MRRHTASSRASAKSIHKPARSPRRFASLLSSFPMLAGVASETSRSIKPRELDLRDLRLFVLVRFLTRPTNHPRHAACASNDESKPVRPLFVLEQIQSIEVLFKLTDDFRNFSPSRELLIEQSEWQLT